MAGLFCGGWCPPKKKPLTAKTNWRASVWGRRQVQAINKGDKT